MWEPLELYFSLVQASSHGQGCSLSIRLFTCMRAKSPQSCPTLSDPMDCSLPAFSAHEIMQARILEWIAMPSSRGIFLTQDCICISYV